MDTRRADELVLLIQGTGRVNGSDVQTGGALHDQEAGDIGGRKGAAEHLLAYVQAVDSNCRVWLETVRIQMQHLARPLLARRIGQGELLLTDPDEEVVGIVNVDLGRV